MANTITKDTEEQRLKITTADRVLRELGIIDTIFKAQYLKYDSADPFPFLLDNQGRSGVDGRYVISVNLLSNVELFNLQSYKHEFTTRYEATPNLSLLGNQLNEIKERAIEIRDYYDTKLTKTNKIVDDFIEKNKSLDTLDHFQERLDFLEFHRSTVTIYHYQIMKMYLGIDFGSKNNIINREKYSYNYLSDNSQLASVCQSLIEFIEKFNLPDLGFSKSKHKTKKNMPKHFEIEIRDNGTAPAYLKVFLKGDADFAAVATHLEKLYSVRRVNVTEQRSGKKDLTLYPEKAYTIEEVKDEVSLTLTAFYEGSPVDPSFATETISSVSEIAYFQIIDYIIQLGKNLESFKELNEKFDEERYRDYFIPFLNSISQQHSAKGEVFNRKGKTDVLVFDNSGNNIFIAECKLWKGEKYLIDAIDQLLLNYVNWRDEKLAIIIFNRDVKKFSDVIDTAVKAVQGHKQCLKFIGKRKDTSYSFIFKHPDDDKKTILLELVLLNFA